MNTAISSEAPPLDYNATYQILKLNGTSIAIRKTQPNNLLFIKNIAIMKTRFFSIIGMVILFVATTTARDNKSNIANTPSPAGELLKKEIKYPVVAKELDISGSVYFVLKSNGKEQMEYTKVYASSDLLKKEVEQQLKKLEPQLAKVMKNDDEKVFKLKFVKNN